MSDTRRWQDVIKNARLVQSLPVPESMPVPVPVPDWENSIRSWEPTAAQLDAEEFGQDFMAVLPDLPYRDIADRHHVLVKAGKVEHKAHQIERRGGSTITYERPRLPLLPLKTTMILTDAVQSALDTETPWTMNQLESIYAMLAL